MENIVTLISEWYGVVLAIVGVAALIATKTPNTSDDRIIQIVLDVVNFVGGNFGKSANDPEVE